VGDFAVADRPDPRCFHSYNSSCLAVERRNLDLKGAAVGVGVRNSPHVPRFEAFLWHRRRKYYAIEFVDDHTDSQFIGYAVPLGPM
jgi:hypothetical protein